MSDSPLWRAVVVEEHQDTLSGTCLIAPVASIKLSSVMSFNM